MEVKLSWNALSDRMYTVAPTGMPREQLYELLFNRAARGSQRNPYEEKAPWTCPQRSPGMVGAMPRVDAVLQMPMCATGGFRSHFGSSFGSRLSWFKPSWAGSCSRRYRTPRFSGFLASVKTPRFSGFLELTAPGSGLHALVVF